MIVDLGYSAFLTSLIVAFIGGTVPLYIARKSDSLGFRFAQINTGFVFTLLLVAMGSLFYAFVFSDFSLKVVFFNSRAEDSFVYRLVALWSNHEGSMLLWIMVMSIYAVVLSLSGTKVVSSKDRMRMLSIFSLIIFGFLVFTFMTSNPFTSLAVQAQKGLGINPMLQDPSMTFHPPSLYFGYIGFVVPFIIALVFMWRGEFSRKQATWLRFWILLPWMLLTFGVAAGSFWAYYELGWGGWWAWDPVENASLLPWLFATAALHAITVYKNTGQLKLWSLFLALGTFLTSMLGTYITRSGIVASVHGFAKDETRGLYLLIITGVLTVVSLSMLTFRSFTLYQGSKRIHLRTKSGLIAIGTTAIFIVAVIMICGTLYPCFSQFSSGENTGVNEAFFNSSINPFVLLILSLMGFVFLFGWSKSKDLWHKFKTRMITLNLGILIIVLYLYHDISQNYVAIFALGFAVWVVCETTYVMIKSIFTKNSKENNYTMFLAHIGFAVTIMGMSIDSMHVQEDSLWLHQGVAQKFSDYEFELKGIVQEKRPTHLAEIAILHVKNMHGEHVATMLPETRLYEVRNSLISKSALKQRYYNHIYVVLGPRLEDGARMIKVSIHPFVWLIWLGALIMVFAAFLGLVRKSKLYKENII